MSIVSTARIFQLIDLERLSPELATQLRLAHTRQKESATTALPKMVQLLMEAEPGTYDAAIDQARHWFTRNLEQLDLIEQETKSLCLSEELTFPGAEVLEGCWQGRMVALHILKRLNTQYEREAFPSEDTLKASGQSAVPNFEVMHQEFSAFYAEMETVESQILESALKLVSLRNQVEFEAQTLKFEEKLDAQNQLGRQLEMLRRRSVASEIKVQPEVQSDYKTRSWIQLENEANQWEVIALEQNYAEAQQKAAQLEKELNELRQILERMRNPYLGATVKDIEDLTAIQPPKLSQQAILKRIQKLRENGWLPARHLEEKNTLYYFDKEQVRIILTYPRKKKPVQNPVQKH